MRVNQRYFAFRNADGFRRTVFRLRRQTLNPRTGGGGLDRRQRARACAPRFCRCAALLGPGSQGAAGVSRCRNSITSTFHAKLGSQGERGTAVLKRLAEEIGPPRRWPVRRWPRDAARLAKADLVTGMVGEFPELQGGDGSLLTRCMDGEGRHWSPMPSVITTRRRARPTRCPPPPCRSPFALAEQAGSSGRLSSRSANVRPGQVIRTPLRPGSPGYHFGSSARNGLRLNLLPLVDLAGQAWHHRGVHPVPPREIS